MHTLKMLLIATILGPQLAIAQAASEIVTLTDSLDPLSNGFNADAGQHKVVAILSPT